MGEAPIQIQYVHIRVFLMTCHELVVIVLAGKHTLADDQLLYFYSLGPCCWNVYFTGQLIYLYFYCPITYHKCMFYF